MTSRSEAITDDRLFKLTNAFAKRFVYRIVHTPDGFELRDARDDSVHHQIDDLAAFAKLNRVEAVMAQDPKTL